MTPGPMKAGALRLLAAMPAPAASAAVALVGGIRRRLARRGSAQMRAEVAARAFAVDGHHCFFGYYDVTPFDRSGRKLLAGICRARLDRRSAGTVLEIGFFDLERSGAHWTPFGSTTTWCWQQGARLQWTQAFDPDCVIYNRTVGGEHGAVVQEVATSKIVREVPAPLYAVHPSSRVGISLNFARLQRLRPGYGYDDIPDATSGVPAPADDGLWRVDLETGARELVFSLADAAALEPQESMRGAAHYLNHVSWNPSGSRFLVFHLWQSGARRRGRALTLDADGGGRFLVTNESHVSHYCWLNDATLLLTSSHGDTGTGFHVYGDRKGLIASWPREQLPIDGHPSLSPRGRWLVCDTMPDRYRERQLFLYDTVDRVRVDLGSFSTPSELRGDRRCDLHPRWNHDGTAVCIDASHTGVRTLQTFDVAALTGATGSGA